MQVEWNMRDFTRLCKENGFKRVKQNFYARCIGDGVYQTIHTGYKQYIYPFSSEYSEKHRKANTISIGIWSLYAKWDDPLDLLGMYSPGDLEGKREIHFQGFGAHCKQMVENGFSFLNGITTQEKLLEARMKIDSNYGSGKWIHDVWLSAPLMACGKWEEATDEVCRHYTHTWDAFFTKYAFLRNEERYEEYFAKEREYEQHLQLTTQLWNKLLGSHYAWIQEFLKENLNRNMQYLQDCGIEIQQF